jgi:nicotinate-nucleotide pyrophosphorylase (carboxylating)
VWSQQTIDLIRAAYDEDLGRTGDITSALLGERADEVDARLIPRHDGVICGLALAPAICEIFSERLGPKLDFHPAPRGAGEFMDGQPVAAGQTVALVRGPKTAVLALERTLLNFLGRLSGVATLTHRYVQTARQVNRQVEVLDTRKTIPGWRELDKYAVRMGGGTNHRLGLHDAILIKDNHLAAIPTGQLRVSLAALLRKRSPAAKFVEVEVDRHEQLVEVCQVPGVDYILLDNFKTDETRRAVEYLESRGLRGKIRLEASGRVSLDTIAAIAATGVDRISVGALTHSAAVLDIGLDL